MATEATEEASKGGGDQSLSHATGPIFDEGTGVLKARYRDVALAMLGLLVLALGMLMSYSGAFAKPQINGVELSVAGNSEPVSKLAQNEDLDIDVVDDKAAAVDDVKERESDGALVFPDDPSDGKVQTYVASGTSKTQAMAIEKIGDQVAKEMKTSNEVHDLAKLSDDNPSGTIEFYIVVFVGLGASLGATVLGRVLGTVDTATRFVERGIVLLVYSAVLAGFATFWADKVLEGLTHDVGKMFGGMWLYSLAVGGAVTGIAAVGGSVVALFVTVVIILFGNPSSGGPYGIHMTNDFYQALYYVFPQGDGLELLRSITYFDDAGAEAPLIRLGIWGGVGILLMLVAMLVRVRKDMAAGADRRLVEAEDLPEDAPEGAVVASAASAGPTSAGPAPLMFPQSAAPAFQSPNAAGYMGSANVPGYMGSPNVAPYGPGQFPMQGFPAGMSPMAGSPAEAQQAYQQAQAQQAQAQQAAWFQAQQQATQQAQAAHQQGQDLTWSVAPPAWTGSPNVAPGSRTHREDGSQGESGERTRGDEPEGRGTGA